MSADGPVHATVVEEVKCGSTTEALLFAAIGTEAFELISQFAGFCGTLSLLGTCRRLSDATPQPGASTWRALALQTLSLPTTIKSDSLDWRNVAALVHLNLVKLHEKYGRLIKSAYHGKFPPYCVDRKFPCLLGNNGTGDCSSKSHYGKGTEMVQCLEKLNQEGCGLLSKRIVQLLNELVTCRASTQVHCGGTFDRDPQLFIPATSTTLPYPLTPMILRQLIEEGRCEVAPLGRGTETLVDTSARKCWRMEIGKDVLVLDREFHKGFLVSNDSEAELPMSLIKAELCPHLYGRGELIAQPYQLLIYEEGGMFKDHRDTLRGVGHIGSCVVSLPVVGGCSGGELVLKHKSVTGDAAEVLESVRPPHESEKSKWNAFFTDLVHEVCPVTQGYRVSLSYHIWYKPESNLHQLPLPEKKTKLERDVSWILGKSLEHWLDNNFLSAKFVLALNHKYSDMSLTQQSLRGRDHALFQCLKAATKDTKLKLELKILEVQIDINERIGVVGVGSGDYDTEPASWAPDSVHMRYIWVNRAQFMAMNRELVEFRYDTGNEGAALEYLYKHACILVHHSDHDDDSEE